jgi:endonuclease-3
VGRKTANVVLNTAFRQPVMAVDTHIFRVSNRTGLAPGKTVLAVEKKLLTNVPPSYLLDAHHWLILHGRYTCLARSPKCGDCIVKDLCSYRYKSSESTAKPSGKSADRTLLAAKRKKVVKKTAATKKKSRSDL